MYIGKINCFYFDQPENLNSFRDESYNYSN